MMSAACVSVRVEVRVPTEVRYYPVNEKVAVVVHEHSGRSGALKLRKQEQLIALILFNQLCNAFENASKLKYTEEESL